LGRKLQPHGFLAFNPVGLFEGGKVKPAHGLLAFPHDLATVINQPVHTPDLAALKRYFLHVHIRCVIGAKYITLHPRPCCIGRHGRARIAVCGHGQAPYPQLFRHGNRKRKAARLEAARG
jgi:hypothetical protein